VSEREDLELQALQRELDAAFETTRPRQGFEDELWLRMQARRPFWSRWREGLSALTGRLVAAPAVPLAAVAVLLVAVVGVGILGSSGLRLGGGNPTAGSKSDNALAPGTASAHFGPIPVPSPGRVQIEPSLPGEGPVFSTTPGISGASLYFGPATLTWSGVFPAGLTQAPVFRYSQPDSAQADRFAASLGAVSASSSSPVAGPAGQMSYAGQGFSLTVLFGSGQPPREPSYDLTPSPAPAASAGDGRDVAIAFLAVHGLTPTWGYVIATQTVGGLTRVELLRRFDLPGGTAYLVNWAGERYGASVDINGGSPLSASGPLPVDLQTADYRLISNASAARLAISSPAAGPVAISPVPAVTLTNVELVYTLVVSGGLGYYEPTYLFSGTFVHDGSTYVKRVLVPLVDPAQGVS
jgi:hypothetical protein